MISLTLVCRQLNLAGFESAVLEFADIIPSEFRDIKIQFTVIKITTAIIFLIINNTLSTFCIII